MATTTTPINYLALLEVPAVQIAYLIELAVILLPASYAFSIKQRGFTNMRAYLTARFMAEHPGVEFQETFSTENQGAAPFLGYLAFGLLVSTPVIAGVLYACYLIFTFGTGQLAYHALLLACTALPVLGVLWICWHHEALLAPVRLVVWGEENIYVYYCLFSFSRTVTLRKEDITGAKLRKIGWGRYPGTPWLRIELGNQTPARCYTLVGCDDYFADRVRAVAADNPRRRGQP